METNASGSLLTAASDASFARWPDSEPFLRRARFGSSGIHSSGALKGGGVSRETARESRGFQSRRCGVCEFFGKQQLRETVEAFRVWRRRRRCLDADADASQGGLTPGVRDRSVGGGADGDGHEGRSGDVRFTRLILYITRYYGVDETHVYLYL